MTDPVRQQAPPEPSPAVDRSASAAPSPPPPEVELSGSGAVSPQVSRPDNLTSRHATRPRRRRWWDEWPLLAVLATAITGLGIVASDHFKRGTFVFGAALLLGAALRALLSDEQAGLLKVRGRTVDLLTLGFFAVATITLSLVVPPPSP